MKEKLDTLTYSGSGRVITCGYDANQGRLNSLKYSDIDPNNPFTLSYDNAGRMSSITDPNSQPVATYTYGATQGKLSMINYGNGNTASFTWNTKNKITNYVYTDNTQQPASTKAYEVSYYDDGRPAGYSYTLDTVYQYEWKFYYSPAGLDKAEKYYYTTQLIDIDTTVAPNGKVLSMTYNDYSCQTGSCYSGEAYLIYDPCDNLISIIDNATSTEIWARAIDKNTNGTIGFFNPYTMEIPIGGIGMTNPIYDQPINGPIDIYIGETGDWSNNVQIGNWAKLTTYIGPDGVNHSMHGDDDCGASPCSGLGTKLELCIARCFTYGVDGIGDLDVAESTDSWCKKNLSLFNLAQSQFIFMYKEMDHDSKMISAFIAAAIAGLVYCPELTIPALWESGILLSVGIGSFYVSLMALQDHIEKSWGFEDAHPGVEAAYNSMKASLLEITMIDGNPYTDDDLTVGGSLKKLYKGIVHKQKYVNECFKLLGMQGMIS